MYLLDTNTVSEILKGRNAHVVRRAADCLRRFGRFTFSLMTRCEILRGLKAKAAAAQLARFDTFCRNSDVLPLDDDVLVSAADLYAALRSAGRLKEDADLIIAATAQRHSRILVTGNTAHFARIPGLTLEDWTQP